MHFFLLYTPFYVGEEFVLWGKPIREKFIILCQYIYPCCRLPVSVVEWLELGINIDEEVSGLLLKVVDKRRICSKMGGINNFIPYYH